MTKPTVEEIGASIVDEVKTVGGRVDDLEEAVSERNENLRDLDQLWGEIKATKGEIEALRTEFNSFKREVREVVQGAVKDDIGELQRKIDQLVKTKSKIVVKPKRSWLSRLFNKDGDKK